MVKRALKIRKNEKKHVTFNLRNNEVFFIQKCPNEYPSKLDPEYQVYEKHFRTQQYFSILEWKLLHTKNEDEFSKHQKIIEQMQRKLKKKSTQFQTLLQALKRYEEKIKQAHKEEKKQSEKCLQFQTTFCQENTDPEFFDIWIELDSMDLESENNYNTFLSQDNTIQVKS